MAKKSSKIVLTYIVTIILTLVVTTVICYFAYSSVFSGEDDKKTTDNDNDR